MAKSCHFPICPIHAFKPSDDPRKQAGGPRNTCTPIGPFLKESRLTAWTVKQPFTWHHGSAIPSVSLKVSCSAPFLCSYPSNSPVPHHSTSRCLQTLHALRDQYIAGYYLIWTCGQPRIQPGSAKAQEANLTTEKTFPGLISKSDATQMPPRPGGRGKGRVRCSSRCSLLAKGNPCKQCRRDYHHQSQLHGSVKTRSRSGRDSVPAAATRSPRQQQLGRPARTSYVCT